MAVADAALAVVFGTLDGVAGNLALGPQRNGRSRQQHNHGYESLRKMVRTAIEHDHDHLGFAELFLGLLEERRPDAGPHDAI